MTFVWPNGDLNDEQVDAITTPGNVFLTACPGSGKTRALTYKAALELSRLPTSKQRVVAITYTHRAAEEVHERIEALGVETERLWIGTIHSFCIDWILRPYGIYHPALRHGFRVIDAHETERRLAEHCRALHNGVRPFDCSYSYTTAGCELRDTHGRSQQAVRNVLNRYWADLEAQRQIDFEMILHFAHELIATVPSIAILLSQLFRFILVDEYQDTKEIQYGIIAHIMRAGAGRTNAFLVGDANQAIFGSLGGYAITCEQFAEDCHAPFTPKCLSINYRSSTRIVDYFANYNVVPAAMSAQGKNRLFASVISYDHTTPSRNLEAELVRLLRYNIETLGISPREICVIAPQWVALADITRRLVVAMPEYRFDGPGIAPFARNIDNFFYKVARLALTEPSPQLFIRRLRWAGDIILELERAGVHLRGVAPRGLLSMCNAIEVDEEDGLSYLRHFFDEFLTGFGIVLADYPTLANHHDTFFGDSEARLNRLQEDGLQGISDIGMFRRVFATRSGITISTIHNVKGAEFDSVIAFALLQGMVPHFGDLQVETAKKLMYVICSRARKNLHLISETGRMNRGGPYLPTEILAGYAFNYDDVPR
ncbi:UvrD-helicase domain-containing protein [Mesorhizobium sp.]|uniref:UvrD-helicase domain-containing protein n=1 Tax=Mesorhizobium sp. TaxID=1871066 RepID=UPI001212F186|nr:ATP-dependent helicase [Mesorhizobium sp.]TIP11326.1 MAG: ATP-dependent helicase [Mesorhizobium sp.]